MLSSRPSNRLCDAWRVADHLPHSQDSLSMIDATFVSQASALPVSARLSFLYPHIPIYLTTPLGLFSRSAPSPSHSLQRSFLSDEIDESKAFNTTPDVDYPRRFSQADIDRFLSHASQVSYHQVIVPTPPPPFNPKPLSGGISASPLPSGHSFGAAHWLFSAPDCKATLPPTPLQIQLLFLGASPSTPWRFASPPSPKAALAPDVLVVSAPVAETPPLNFIQTVLSLISATVGGGGCVAIPTCADSAFELIDALLNCPASPLSNIPIFYVAPGAQLALTTISIAAEWCAFCYL
jgi:Cft2 family RNA processing exonuclease